jgi:hypothetical protein
LTAFPWRFAHRKVVLLLRFVELASKYHYTQDGESLPGSDEEVDSASFQQLQLPVNQSAPFEPSRPQRHRLKMSRHLGMTFEELARIFDVLDVNHDRSITHAEFLRGLKQHDWIAEKLGRKAPPLSFRVCVSLPARRTARRCSTRGRDSRFLPTGLWPDGQ